MVSCRRRRSPYFQELATSGIDRRRVVVLNFTTV
jgi:hypothetical protein